MPWVGQKWDYRSESSIHLKDETLAEYGRQGWELVGVTPLQAGKVRAFFKRPA